MSFGPSNGIHFYILFQFDEDELGEVQIQTSAGRKRLFSKELRCMMYGFGDDKNPYTESVDLLEDLVIEYITETTHRFVHLKHHTFCRLFKSVNLLTEPWR